MSLAVKNKGQSININDEKAIKFIIINKSSVRIWVIIRLLNNLTMNFINFKLYCNVC